MQQYSLKVNMQAIYTDSNFYSASFSILKKKKRKQFNPRAVVTYEQSKNYCNFFKMAGLSIQKLNRDRFLIFFIMFVKLEAKLWHIKLFLLIRSYVH